MIRRAGGALGGGAQSVRLALCALVVGGALQAPGGRADPPPRDYLTGGAWDVEGAAALPRPGDVFLGALFDGYVARARSELAAPDWPDTAVLVDRIRQVAAGEAPPPFELADYELSPVFVAALTPARAELEALLANPGAQLRAPAALGRAQVEFDCWVEQAEEGWQTAEIAACQTGFDTATAEVREAAELPASFAVVLPEEGEIGGIMLSDGTNRMLLAEVNAGAGMDGAMRQLPLADSEVATTFKDALGARPLPAREFTLVFAYNATRLDPGAEAALAEIVADIARRPAAEVIVTGHTDAPGDVATNQAISRSRALAVQAAIKGQVPAGAKVRYRLAAKGETAMVVPTAQPEEANRRVSVLVR